MLNKQGLANTLALTCIDGVMSHLSMSHVVLIKESCLTPQ